VDLDDSSSSHESNSPDRLSSHAEDVDDSELTDADENNDLNGKDVSSLEDIFKSEVCQFCECIYHYYIIICSQHATWPHWANPDGLVMLFNNDDMAPSPTKSQKSQKSQNESHRVESMLFSDSDLGKTPATGQPEPEPAMCKLLGDLPPQGGSRQPSEPVRSHCQQAHDLEVLSYCFSS
jgi:hypothetical protein